MYLPCFPYADGKLKIKEVIYYAFAMDIDFPVEYEQYKQKIDCNFFYNEL